MLGFACLCLLVFIVFELVVLILIICGVLVLVCYLFRVCFVVFERCVLGLFMK